MEEVTKTIQGVHLRRMHSFLLKWLATLSVVVLKYTFKWQADTCKSFVTYFITKQHFCDSELIVKNTKAI
jgi:hypothetical protein